MFHNIRDFLNYFGLVERQLLGRRGVGYVILPLWITPGNGGKLFPLCPTLKNWVRRGLVTRCDERKSFVKSHGVSVSVN